MLTITRPQLRAARLLMTLGFPLHIATAGALELEVTPAKTTLHSNNPTIHYQLPRNYFQFAFKLKTTTVTQGQYCDVARYFFEMPSDSTCDQPNKTTQVDLTDQITVSQLAEPDPAATFDLMIKGGTFAETSVILGFGDANILTGAQGSIADHKVDFFMSIFKTVASAAAHVIPLALAAPPPPLQDHSSPGGEKPKTDAVPTSCENQLDERERALWLKLGDPHKNVACGLTNELRSAYLGIPDAFKPYVDTYQRDGKVFDAHFANALALFVEYSTLNADEATFLHPGRIPISSDTFTALKKARDDRKTWIRQRFLGSTEESTDDLPQITWRFGQPGKEIELFSFDSAKGGFCFGTVSAERWVARPIGLDRCDSKSDTLISVFAILLVPDMDPSKAHQPDPVNVPDNGIGVAYRIPRRSYLRVFARKHDSTEYDYFYSAYEIAQYGEVKFLPSKIGSSSSYNVSLDPLTGSLKNVTIGAKPLLSGDIGTQANDLSTSILGIVDAVHSAKKKPSPLEATQSEEQLKLEQLKIQMIDSCKIDPTQSFCATLFN